MHQVSFGQFPATLVPPPLPHRRSADLSEPARNAFRHQLVGNPLVSGQPIQIRPEGGQRMTRSLITRIELEPIRVIR